MAELGSLALSSGELILHIMAGAAIGLVAVGVSSKIYTPTIADGGAMTMQESLMLFLYNMIAPVLVVFAAPFILDMLPGSDAGNVFGLIFALNVSAAGLVSQVSMVVSKYI